MIKLFYIIFDEKYANKPSAMKLDADWLSKLGYQNQIEYIWSQSTDRSRMREYNRINKKSINLILMIWSKYKIAHYMYDSDNITSGDPKRIPETSIVKLIPKLMLENKFEPIPKEVCKYLEWTYEHDKGKGEYNSSRPVNINLNKRNHTKKQKEHIQSKVTYGKK